MKISPVSFGTFRVTHVDTNKSYDELHELAGKVLEDNDFEYNDQTEAFDEYVYRLPFASFGLEAKILDRLYYTNEYWPIHQRVHATSVINTNNDKKVLLLTGENGAVEQKARKTLENSHGFYCYYD